MSLQAYQQTSARAETTQQSEYRLFGQVTRALIAASELDMSDLGDRVDALDWNRRMWTALASDCSAPGNNLPDALRAGIISLAIWVGKHTSLVIRGEDDIEDLIEINRMIMQGLSQGMREAA
jgi:flagellar biosynthesis activator protein FlaF